MGTSVHIWSPHWLQGHLGCDSSPILDGSFPVSVYVYNYHNLQSLSYTCVQIDLYLHIELPSNEQLSKLNIFSLWSGVEPGGDGQEPALENCWMQCSVWGGPPSWLWLASFWCGLSHLHARVTSLLHWLIEVIPISRMQEQGVPNLGHFWGICSLHIVPMNHYLNAPRMVHNRLIYVSLPFFCTSNNFDIIKKTWYFMPELSMGALWNEVEFKVWECKRLQD